MYEVNNWKQLMGLIKKEEEIDGNLNSSKSHHVHFKLILIFKRIFLTTHFSSKHCIFNNNLGLSSRIECCINFRWTWQNGFTIASHAESDVLPYKSDLFILHKFLIPLQLILMLVITERSIQFKYNFWQSTFRIINN